MRRHIRESFSSLVSHLFLAMEICQCSWPECRKIAENFVERIDNSEQENMDQSIFNRQKYVVKIFARFRVFN